MTRFKELRRVERAIEHNSKSELLWALNYCRMRYNDSKMKNGKKYWHQFIRRIEKDLVALESVTKKTA